MEKVDDYPNELLLHIKARLELERSKWRGHQAKTIKNQPTKRMLRCGVRFT